MPFRDTTSPNPGAAPNPLESLRGGIIVSCQARPGNPLEGAEAMALMARAAELGGARGLRVNGARDIAAVGRASTLPIVGISRVEHPDSAVTITPTVASAETILETGIRMVALDATQRARPGGEGVEQIVAVIHAGGALALGDLATIDDLGPAVRAGVDAVGTTLSGYVAGTPRQPGPDFALLAELVKRSAVPVFAEGRYWTPEDVRTAFEIGAAFVVIGTAITNPMAITSRFVAAIGLPMPDGR